MSQFNFPFSAVSGQALFKMALILNAINPAIGGVLVNGPRGSAKSTLARGFADILPKNNDEQLSKLVTLPLSATEDMLVGSLDLQQVLTTKSVDFKPGLLAKAHQGILYVDEVNLLADPLVDLLLDVSASGVNYIERDGISHEHAARFILLGTMNPEEGELRAQLLDRFGLSVHLSDQYSIEERVDIVCLREAFDRDPAAFLSEYQSQQTELQTRIQQAQQSLAGISCSSAMRIDIAKRCDQAHVDGLRADIVWLKTAQAHAAWQGRESVTLDDVNAVEELVLGHRRQQGATSSQSSSQSNSLPENTRSPEQTRSDNTELNNSKSDDSNGSSAQAQQESQADSGGQSEWGYMPPSGQDRAPIDPTLELQPQPRFMRARENKKKHYKSLISSQSKAGEILGGQRHSSVATQQPDWFNTLISTLDEWPPRQLRYKKANLGQPILHLILLDTSGSTLQKAQLGQAKTVIMSIAEQAYQQRQQLCIFGFGNESVELIMPQQKAPKQLKQWLDNIQAGGGTPMQTMLAQARKYQDKLMKSSKQEGIYHFHNYLITDGRVSQDMNELALNGHTLLIDTEDSPVKRGRGRELAQQLSAEYCALSS